ncbi:MAG: dTDP-4-dehydrorhamnose 3,5-epimerase family protein [Planctomycetota bacterium]|nr:dTDP-4-dehydrorhamnose 3,5-epimerase family protein [Planctomycetota bacterium]MDA1180460.1 dTDP-4-dehydrorhamnose 3,5-epimerase family protein [Planctomycetota bacterium]
MRFVRTKIDAVWIAEIEPMRDARGLFARVWCEFDFLQHGIATRISQCSLAWTQNAGTVRGLHFQRPPHWEEKVVRCVRGAAYVVAVDLRVGSPTHRSWVGVELTAENRRAIVVGQGCAQGYQTLSDDTELLYQMSQPYVQTSADGYRYDDPAFHVQWPLAVTIVSEKDQTWEPYTW